MHILFIPSWLSVKKKDHQLGSFFVEQAEALANKNIEVGILYNNAFTIKSVLKEIFFLIFKKSNYKYGLYYNNGINFLLFFSIIGICKQFKFEKIFYFFYLKAFNRYINKFGLPDIIHFQSIISVAKLPKILKEKYNIPIVITEHFSGYQLGTVSKKIILDSKQNLEISEKFYAVSDVYKDTLNKLFETKKIKVMPNNISNYLLNDFNYKKNKIFTFIIVGNLFKIKNQALALNSFKKFLDKYPNAQLKIVGAGEELKKLKKLTNKLLINDKVFFLGKLNRIDTLHEIAKSHVLLVTSKFETFSVVTTEAFSLKTIVISTKCGGPEMLINHLNGQICVENKNYHNVMISVYENYTRYNLEKIRKSCIKKYSGERISTLLIADYKKIYRENKLR